MLRTFLVCTALLLDSNASATVWVETPDAGNNPAMAQTTSCSGPLTAIQGHLDTDTDQDFYCIQITDPANFRAVLNCVQLADNDLWLFNPAGLGIALDDGCAGGQTSIGAPLVPTAGIYYLAVTPSGDEALSGGLPIWNPPTVSTQRSPDGPGAGGAFNGWSNTGVVSNFNNYTIQITGAICCDAPVPTVTKGWGTLKAFYR